MPETTVAKFGGTSMRDVDRVMGIMADQQQEVLVVSAPAGVTNELLAYHRVAGSPAAEPLRNPRIRMRVVQEALGLFMQEEVGVQDIVTGGKGPSIAFHTNSKQPVSEVVRSLHGHFMPPRAT